MKRVFDDPDYALGFAQGIDFVNDSSVKVNSISIYTNKEERHNRYAVDITLEEEEESDYDETHVLEEDEGLVYVRDVPKGIWSMY